MMPDDDRRVDGTSYPSDRAPAGSEPLWPRWSSLRERAASFVASVRGRLVVALVRPRAGDVLILHGADVPAALVRGANLELRRRGVGAVVVLPGFVSVHAEPAKLAREDRGYRETATYGTDRGVHTGVPGAESRVTPHPESEQGS